MNDDLKKLCFENYIQSVAGVSHCAIQLNCALGAPPSVEKRMNCVNGCCSVHKVSVNNGEL